MKVFTWVALAAALFLGVVISPFASSWLDGLERVAEDKGFVEIGEGEPAVESPVPGYAFPGIGHEKFATALAAGAGTILAFVATLGLAGLLRKGNR